MKFYANKVILGADKDFKLRVLDEQHQKIDVRRRARRSVQAVGEVQLTLRNLSREQVVRARSAIELIIRGYKEAGAESVIGLGTRCVGDTTADIARLVDWDDVRLRLVNKNSSLPRLWPRPSHREAKAEEIIALREAMEQSRAEQSPSRNACVRYRRSLARLRRWSADAGRPIFFFTSFRWDDIRHILSSNRMLSTSKG